MGTSCGFFQMEHEPAAAPKYGHSLRTWYSLRLLHGGDDDIEVGAHLRIGARSVAQLMNKRPLYADTVVG